MPTIVFNNGVLSSDEAGNLTWNGDIYPSPEEPIDTSNFVTLEGDNEFSRNNNFTGTLTIDGKEVVTTDFLNDINWDSDITKDPYIGINNSKVSGPYIYFRRGDSTTSAGSIELSARNATSASKTLKLNTDGTLTWNGKNVLTEGSVKSSLIETWKNGTSWYRKYSDGWIEQGGYVTTNSNTEQTINLHTAFSNTNYFLVKQLGFNGFYGSGINGQYTSVWGLTTSSFKTYGYTTTGVNTFRWYACGY